MNPVSVDIKDLLVADGLGEFAGTASAQWAIFISEEPDKPNMTITIYDTPGEAADKVMDGGADHFMHSGFQLRVRAKRYLTAHAHIEECRKALDRRGKFKIDKTHYDNINMDPEPLPIGKDSQGRHTFTINGIGYRQERP